MLPITEIHLPGLTASAAPAPAAPAPDTATPIARRCRWNLTISGKAEYYDAAGTTSIPQSLGEAIVLLYIAAHLPEHFWTSRAPEHEDGMDTVLPFGMDPVSLRRDIAAWAARTFRHDEDAAIMALALQIWVDGHATYAVPIDVPSQKKNGTAPHWTECYVQLLTGGDPEQRHHALHRLSLRDAHAAMHARLHAAGVDCLTASQRAARAAAVESQLSALNL